jgi:hypothetical protein
MPLGRQLLVPAGLVDKVDVDNKRVVVGADRKRIENAPEYHPEQPLADPAHSVFGNYFGSLMDDVSGRTGQKQSAQPRRTASKARPARAMSKASRPSRARARTPRRASNEATKEELYVQAKRLGIEGRSKMNKAALARAVGRGRSQSGRRASKAKATPVEVQAFLEGVGYPTGKRQLLRQAEGRRASRKVRATLERLPDKQFSSPTQVRKEIGRLG